MSPALALLASSMFTLPWLAPAATAAGDGSPGCPQGAVRKNALALRQAPGVPAGLGRVKLAVWGDSHTAAPGFLQGLADRFPLAAPMPGLVPAGAILPGAVSYRADVCAFGWKAVQRPGPRDFSLLQQAQSDRADSVLELRFPTPVAAVTLHYLRDDPERSLLVAQSVNGGAERIVALDAGAAPGKLEFGPAPGGVRSLRLRLVAGHLGLVGLEFPGDGDAGSVLDVFSVNGATVRTWASTESLAPLKSVVGTRRYDAVVLQYGTNDAPAPSAERVEGLYQMLRNVRRTFPQSRCVVVGPPDRGGAQGGVPWTQVHADVSREQEAAAQRYGCSFWDWQRLMRDSGGAAGWGRSGLMQPDLLHLTSAGYVRSGAAFAQWLREWLR